MARELETNEWEDDSDVVSGPRAGRAARANQREQAQWEEEAYQLGLSGLPELPGWSSNERAAYSSGRDDAGTAALRKQSAGLASDQGWPAQGQKAPKFKAPKPTTISDGIAGFVLGAVVAANALAYLGYGAAGVKSWWSAKFWNTPTLGTSSQAPTSSQTPANAPGGGGSPFPGTNKLEPLG